MCFKMSLYHPCFSISDSLCSAQTSHTWPPCSWGLLQVKSISPIPRPALPKGAAQLELSGMMPEDCQLWVLQGHRARKYPLPTAVSVRITFALRTGIQTIMLILLPSKRSQYYRVFVILLELQYVITGVEMLVNYLLICCNAPE